MVKIGIVGSDNSHAIAFSKLCNASGGRDGLRVRGARVTHLFGLNQARNEEVAAAGDIPTIVADPAEMLGRVDAVLVVFRHGGLHAQYALPFIKAGVPVFVDKPLACTVTDAKKLVAAAKRSGSGLTSFSTVRYAGDTVKVIKDVRKVGPLAGGVVFGPADAASEYGGLIFYGIHTVEIMLEVFGYDVASVRAVQSEMGVTATCAYRDGALVTLQFVTKGARGFGVMVHTQKGHVVRELNLSTCYRDGFRVYFKMFKTGAWPLTGPQLVRPIEVMEAIVASYTSGEAVKLRKMRGS